MSVALFLTTGAAGYYAPITSRPAVMQPQWTTARTFVSRACKITAMEAQEAYRLLGLGEDATYDEIETAYNELAAKYEGDVKKKIKLQVAKDEIMDDRLRAVTSGRFKGTPPVNPFERPEGPKPLITIPPALQGIMELPTRAYALKNAAVFGAIGLLPLLSASFASTSVSLGFAVGLYLLYNRGVEVSQEGAEYRQFKAKPLIKTAGITFLAGAVGGTLSQLAYGFLRFMFSQELVIAMFTSAGFWFSSSLFKAQDDY